MPTKNANSTDNGNINIRSILEDFCQDMERRGKSALTIEAYRRDIKQFISFIDEKGYIPSVGAITADIIEEWDSTHMDKLKESSRNRKMSGLASFFDFVRRRRLISEDPMDLVERVKEVDEESPCPTAEEVRRILEAEDYGEWRLIFWFLSETGLRRSELLDMDISDLNLERAEILVRHGKGNKQRTVPLLNKELVEALTAYVSSRESDECAALFMNKQGARISRSSLSSRFTCTLQRAGLKDKGYTLHSFRHYFMTQRLNEGYSIHLVQRWAGHSDPSMTLKTYAHVTEDIENARVAAKREPYIPSGSISANMVPMPTIGADTAITPPVVYIPVGGRVVPLPVLGTILLVSGESMMSAVNHQPAA